MKQIFTFLFTFLLFATYAQSCAGRYQSEIYTSVDVTTVEFGEALTSIGDTQVLEMDIYQAVGDTATDRPVVIFCFGGSFVGGSRTSGELVSFATSLAKRGFVCASIDYRLAGSALELVSQEGMIKVVFAAVQDGKASIRYFRKNFDEGNSLGISPDNIFIGGTSAGGILAVNLAYVDTLEKLPVAWQGWADEIGGMEGNSGNPGYCSYPNGVFGFAPAIGDTSYLNPNDVPFYSCHATGDQTVQYGFGAPLQGFAPVDLYGSGPMNTRLDNLGIYNVLDTYSGGDHPPLNTAQRMNDTRDNLGDFLYSIITCNPNNVRKSDQQGCESFYVRPVGIIQVQEAIDWYLYPNPASDKVSIVGESAFEAVLVYNQIGQLVENVQLNGEKVFKLDVASYSPGIYFVQVLSNNKWQTEKLVIQ